MDGIPRRGSTALRVFAVVTASAAVALTTACGAASHPAPSHTPTAAATPTTTPATTDLLAGITVSPSEVQAAAAHGNALTIDMLQQLELANPGTNFVDSAYSLATALAMLELGARGDTANQIATGLHDAGVSAEQQAAAWRQLDASLLATATAGGISLDVSNALWLQKGLPVDPSFLDTLVKNFAAPSTQVDFSGDPQGAAGLINNWVSQATQGHIPTLVAPGDIQGLLFALADAIYFDATWQYQFIVNFTSDGTFYRADDSTVSTPLMHSDDPLPLTTYSGNGVTAVELPYVGGHYVADVLMPTSQPIASFVSGLTTESLAGIEQDLTAAQVVLTLPKFNISSQLQLSTLLTSLGMTDAFGGAADFSGIDGRTDLHLGLAKQDATMQVDEVGTTATAATIVGGLGGAGGPIQTVNVVINHPFLFLIRDLSSGAIVFTAEVTDPSATAS